MMPMAPRRALSTSATMPLASTTYHHRRCCHWNTTSTTSNLTASAPENRNSTGTTLRDEESPGYQSHKTPLYSLFNFLVGEMKVAFAKCIVIDMLTFDLYTSVNFLGGYLFNCYRSRKL
ncbi:hypothetical protein EGW08_019412 [Elysia chlorotica]|uniref:Uncharacterized protein n=1 Tax=Elysia chlorotica TaxID=188477 RepID=A0A3S0ZQC8_ELYCH|nr:hypothetical protein EGW08_019412 [Elysia chlorotica]